jgi:hypothetical protein
MQTQDREFLTVREATVKREPLRKIVRKEGSPGHQKTVVQVVVASEREVLSIASLKEKFGLSDSKIGVIIRDAQKQGKIRRTVNGSYAWTQD